MIVLEAFFLGLFVLFLAVAAGRGLVLLVLDPPQEDFEDRIMAWACGAVVAFVIVFISFLAIAIGAGLLGLAHPEDQQTQTPVTQALASAE